MSKTRTAPVSGERPHRLAPGVGGGGYLANLISRVKSFFSKRFEPERRTREIPETPERPASREANLASQPVILKKLQNNYSNDLTSRR
jgi:hypothetical protein